MLRSLLCQQPLFGDFLPPSYAAAKELRGPAPELCAVKGKGIRELHQA
jgi:hypothetical protein